MQVESHRLNELHCFRYPADNASYALVVSHGLGGHGGIYDKFCEHHAAKGAELWCYDAPGHGRSTTNRPRGTWTMDEWAQASRDWATHVHDLTGLPVFTLGSSLGVAPAVSAIDAPAVTGAILMGSAAVPGSPLESWATFFQYNPPQPLADNTKPVLYAVGDKDPNVTPETVRAIADGIGGPVTVEIFADGPHQLMLFETEAFSTLVHDFCTGAVSGD